MCNSPVLLDGFFAFLKFVGERGLESMEKKAFMTLERLSGITRTYPTPFYLYDEKGIRENAKRPREAFSWN